MIEIKLKSTLIIILLMLFNRNYCVIVINSSKFELNDSPIIGIVTEEISGNNGPAKQFASEFKMYIAASYVKFIEGAGGRVVPIWIDKPREYYQELLSKINGVLFPGGSVGFEQSHGYAEAGRHIYSIANKMNENGDVMPIFGTCLGFQLLTYLSANDTEIRADCNAMAQSVPLEFEKDFENSRLFGQDAPKNVIKNLSTEPITSNFHHYCVTKQNITKFGIDTEWKILSQNNDLNGFRYVSSIEHKRYPYYAVQFHPEKNIYEFVNNRNISHTANAIEASQYFANFFVRNCRQNSNHFANVEEENDMLIYNYAANFTGLNKSVFEQIYLFS